MTPAEYLHTFAQNELFWAARHAAAARSKAIHSDQALAAINAAITNLRHAQEFLDADYAIESDFPGE